MQITKESAENVEMVPDEEDRIKKEYSYRDKMMPWDDWKTNIYHPRHPIGHLFQEHNHDVLISALNKLDINLTDLKILDVGCGYGFWLRFLVEIGANAENCYGIDQSPLRIQVAKSKNPSINWEQGSISKLEFTDESFDIVLQTVVFSSILDETLRDQSAVEINRVLKNNGLVVWLDLSNVFSDKLICFSEADVNHYFPNMRIIYRERVHPKYFRQMSRRFSWLAKVIYALVRFECEARFYILRKNTIENE